jgi:membrane-associated protease RseP (regulator of RpoE activity)
MIGWGVGGAARGLLARGKVLRLGTVEVAGPVMELSLQTKGWFTDPYVAGNVGAGVLKRFNITFDYGNQRLIFERNANDARRDSYDRAGVWLNLGAKGYEVVDVVAGGPAAEAGLVVGDTIVTVDGTQASELALPRLRDRFRTDAPGTAVKLLVLRDGVKREVTLVLRDLV